MKSQIVVMLIFAVIQLVLPGCSHGDSEYPRPVNGSALVGSDEALVLTRKGVLKRISLDGTSINVADIKQGVQGMSFISPSEGWAIDADWNSWHFDGGNWAFVGHNNDTKFGLAWPSNVVFADEKVGWARTLGPLFITSDAGETWQKVLVTDPGEFTRISVVDRDTAILYSEKGVIRRTKDRGQTWTDMPIGETGNVTSFACRERDTHECWAGTSRGELLVVADGSASRLHLPKSYGEISILSITFDRASRASFLAGYSYGQSGMGLVIRTDDAVTHGGKWKFPERSVSYRLRALAARSGSQAIPQFIEARMTVAHG